ncbi:MAG: hypothetical protein OXB88_01080 [Bacteriovoracales bacterium]|nr:hypothetical protein [Bacteriovoracales bacterium]
MRYFLRYFILVGLGISLLAFDSIHILPKSKRYQNKVAPFNSRGRDILSSIERQNARIKDLLHENRNRAKFEDLTLAYNVPTGTTLGGRLLTSILSTRLDSPIVVEILGRDVLPEGTRLLCKGSVEKERVPVICQTLVIGGLEYAVKAQILTLKGLAGLKGEVYTGDDQSIAAELSADVLEGIGTFKGAKKAVDEIVSLIRKRGGKNRKIIIHIKADTRVLIYFQKRFMP